MTHIIRTLSAAALTGGLAISLAASAGAQQGPPPPPGPEAGPGGHGDPAQMRARFEARRQQRQQVLHDALGLRPEQEGAWQVFLASRHRPDDHRMRPHEDGEGAVLSTPERLDRMQRRMADRQARFAQQADAIKRFYAALDSRQQKTFDALIAERGHGMGGMEGMGGRRHMGPGAPPPDGERG